MGIVYDHTGNGDPVQNGAMDTIDPRADSCWFEHQRILRTKRYYKAEISLLVEEAAGSGDRADGCNSRTGTSASLSSYRLGAKYKTSLCQDRKA